MTKIVLTTKYSSYNFGAMLQTYALQKSVKKLGAECLVVDADRQKKKGFMAWTSPRLIIQNIFYHLYKDELQTGYKRFDEFIDSYDLTRCYGNYDELKKSPPEADIYLTGSDQVWNPLDIRESYFLRYAPKDKVRASYAASMGISYMPEGAKRIWNEYFQDIDYVSVREKTTKTLIEEMTGREAEVHIDPVLLLSPGEWGKEAIKPNFNKPYIFCYILHRPDWLNKWLKKLHKETGKEIVVISSEEYRNIYHTKMIRDAGPREMLGWLQNADFVISSSFHGVALSIANRMPFYAVVNFEAPARITDMLDTFGLKDRIIDKTHSFELEPVDYEKVGEIQEREKNRSFDYLKFLITKPKKVEIPNNYKSVLKGTVSIVGDKCTGCTVCSYVCPKNAITMQMNDEGFSYPIIDEERCVECSKCIKYCHILEN